MENFFERFKEICLICGGGEVVSLKKEKENKNLVEEKKLGDMRYFV